MWWWGRDGDEWPPWEKQRSRRGTPKVWPRGQPQPRHGCAVSQHDHLIMMHSELLLARGTYLGQRKRIWIYIELRLEALLLWHLRLSSGKDAIVLRICMWADLMPCCGGCFFLWSRHMWCMTTKIFSSNLIFAWPKNKKIENNFGVQASIINFIFHQLDQGSRKYYPRDEFSRICSHFFFVKQMVDLNI